MLVHADGVFAERCTEGISDGIAPTCPHPPLRSHISPNTTQGFVPNRPILPLRSNSRNLPPLEREIYANTGIHLTVEASSDLNMSGIRVQTNQNPVSTTSAAAEDKNATSKVPPT